MPKRKNNYRIILFSFIAALPFWWGTNVLHETLEELFYLKALAKTETVKLNYVHDPWRDSKVTDFQTTAKSAISVFVPFEGQDQILFEKNPETSLPMASITKLMTANVVLKYYNLEEKIKVSQEAVEKQGDMGQLEAGKTFSVRYLLYPLLMESSNDAAFALADDYPGISESEFVSYMNSEADSFGMEDTVFYNSSGLDPKKTENKNHINISTAEDLVRMTKNLLGQNLIWEILAKEEYSEYGPVLKNINQLLGVVPGVVGGKTGFTFKAGECMVLLTKAPKNKGYIISVLLDSDNRFREMERLAKWVKEGYNW